jgi:hypothetical protein
MASYTIANERISREQLQQYYSAAKAGYRSVTWTDLDLIFAIAEEHRDRFPGINLTGMQSPRLYIERWVKGYVDAVNNPPSGRTANPKSACTDPAIKVIVKATQGLTEEEASRGEANHNLFMSAENIQGNLLEEYIAEKTRPYGFLWCDGNVLRAIDFCNSDGTFFLQVKNKSNTENSSSSNIREGTTIEKWYRLGTRTRGGVKIPDYKWPALNALINAHRTQGRSLPPCAMSENDYQQFLTRKAGANHGLITNL